MNTFTTTAGVVYLQSQPVSFFFPSSFTAAVSPLVVVQNWVLWKEVSLEPAQTIKEAGNAEKERIGKIHMALADEDAALAEMGMDEYGRLLDHDLGDDA